MPAKKTAPRPTAPTAAQKRAARESLLAVEKARDELNLRLKELDKQLKVLSIHRAGP